MEIRYKVKSVIKSLREKYGGEWKYHHGGTWEHVGKGFVQEIGILGGFTGDDIVGSKFYYYHIDKDKKTEEVFLY